MYILIYKCIYIYIYLYIYIFICIYVYIYEYIYMCIYVYIYMYIYVYVPVCLSIFLCICAFGWSDVCVRKTKICMRWHMGSNQQYNRGSSTDNIFEDTLLQASFVYLHGSFREILSYILRHFQTKFTFCMRRPMGSIQPYN